MTITGAACLDQLQSTFHAFLDEYMNQIGNKKVVPQLKNLEQKSWFGNYRLFFQEYLKVVVGQIHAKDFLEQSRSKPL